MRFPVQSFSSGLVLLASAFPAGSSACYIKILQPYLYFGLVGLVAKTLASSQ